MANIEWKVQESPFAEISKGFLEQSKNSTYQFNPSAYMADSAYVPPQDYYAQKESSTRNQMYNNMLTNLENPVGNTTQSPSISSVAEQTTQVAMSPITPNKKAYSAFYGDNFRRYAPNIIRLAQENNIDPSELLANAYIESSFNPNAKNNAYGGLHAISMSQHKNWNDPVYNTTEAIKLRNQNKAYAEKLGLKWSPELSYLFHQQGMGGATALLKNGNLTAAQALQTTSQWKNKSIDWIENNIILRNGGKKGMRADSFANLWLDKARRVQSQAKAIESQYGNWSNFLNRG